MNSQKIAIVLPTRGMVFTAVEMALERERQGKEVTIYRSDNLRIPEGHNQLAKQALDSGADYIWFVEEDTVPPVGALDSLLVCNSDIACIDYSVSGWGCVTRNPKGEILWCGLGCTLVKRQVLENMVYPYFNTDKVLRLNDWTWQDLPKDYVENKNYGGLDIWFSWQARQLGFNICQASGECNHLQLEKIGDKGVNGGLHSIAIRPKIINNQTLIEGGD